MTAKISLSSVKILLRMARLKVRTVDGVNGDVKALKIEVNSDNYQLLINILRKAIIENGRGFDAKDDRMANNPNQMNIMSMYSDIDLDANEMELEFKSNTHDLMWFVNTYRGLTNQETVEEVDFIFNRDLPINEGDTINNCKNSVGIISMKPSLQIIRGQQMQRKNLQK